jgi:hypothetical protein
MLRGNIISTHKLAALLLYFIAGFWLENSPDDARIIQFEHIRTAPSELQQKLQSLSNSMIVPKTKTLDPVRKTLTLEKYQQTPRHVGLVRLHAGGMEEAANAHAFVNFANKNFGYGKINQPVSITSWRAHG